MSTANTGFCCLQLIRPPGYTWAQLKDFIAQSTLKERCIFVIEAQNLRELLVKFLELKTSEQSMEDSAAFMIAGIMLHLLRGPDPPMVEMVRRRDFLVKVFINQHTLHPVHLNYFVSQILKHLKVTGLSDIGYLLNLQDMLCHIGTICETAKAIAVCIAWALIAEVTGTGIDMQRFRPFSHMLEMISNMEWNTVIASDSLPNVFVLIRAMGFILNAVAFCANEAFYSAGYRDLKLRLQERRVIYAWCQRLVQDFNKLAFENDDLGEIRTLTVQFILYNILADMDIEDPDS